MRKQLGEFSKLHHYPLAPRGSTCLDFVIPAANNSYFSFGATRSFENMPALGLKNSVQHLAELAAQYPGASDFFAKYLSSSLQLIHLGYYERVAESAVQYAERLLSNRNQNVSSASTPAEIARTLVYGYKDHGFVIDKAEAERIFGTDVIRVKYCRVLYGQRNLRGNGLGRTRKQDV